MAGRLVHFAVAGAAIAGGMVFQGDLDLGSSHDREIDRKVDRSVDRRVDRRVDRSIDRTVDRIVDRATDNIDIRTGDGRSEVDPATKRALAAAIAELVRAEGSLITARIDDDLPAAVITQVEQRRDAARKEVDRIADGVRASSQGDRDELRESIRDDVRESVREAVRS